MRWRLIKLIMRYTCNTVSGSISIAYHCLYPLGVPNAQIAQVFRRLCCRGQIADITSDCNMIHHDKSSYEFGIWTLQFPKSLANPPSCAPLRNAKKYERKDSAEGPRTGKKDKKDKKEKKNDRVKDEQHETETSRKRSKKEKTEGKSKKAKKA